MDRHRHNIKVLGSPQTQSVATTKRNGLMRLPSLLLTLVLRNPDLSTSTMTRGDLDVTFSTFRSRISLVKVYYLKRSPHT